MQGAPHNAAMIVRSQRMVPLDKVDLSIIENCAHSLLIENYTSTVLGKVDGALVKGMADYMPAITVVVGRQITQSCGV